MARRSMTFRASEFEGRADRLQRQMAECDLAAILLTTPADIFYVTGFLTRFWESPTRPWFVVVPRAGDPVAVIPSIGADLMGQTWIDDIRTWDSPDPDDDGVTLLADTLAELTGPGAAIGLPSGPETHVRMPRADLFRLEDAIAPRRLVDATAAVQRVREIKSAAEIDKIRAACDVAGRAFDRVPHFVHAGMPIGDVFGAFQIALLEAGAGWVGYIAGAAGQGGYGNVISAAATGPLVPGDVLMLDTGVVRDGYYCDFDRNFAVGPASADAGRAHHALWRATEEALTGIRPGMRACDMHAMLARSITRHGAEPAGGRLGHGVGVALTEWPSFTARDETVLREGMVLAIEPGAVVAPGRILVHEENVVLRADGCELLSPRAPAELPELSA
ncbi:M24 family metallopeptidase [Palleronia pelagia]|uniref:Xaa-Pro aminopeptidase n=1 Tax=Palleronia pelagia TaxID=387096 RepID=A0A1H8DLK4_9RHOB|nr:Xaa-Pro peptidase family protein [Palleronia pelagia]SEN07417.1 Xaa-Pro aminopeptidase [Palleronia pelagia]